VGRACAAHIRLAHDWDVIHTDNFGGAVPLLAVAGCTVDLDDLRIVRAILQDQADCRRVGLDSIGTQLETLIRCGIAEVAEECFCAHTVVVDSGPGASLARVAPFEMECQHKFAGAFQREMADLFASFKDHVKGISVSWRDTYRINGAVQK
jgi:hypothetical protein